MANTTTVSTQAELLSALKTAGGGDTILLEGGNYGNLQLIDKSTFDLTFMDTVTIKAADPENPPVVTGLDMRNASNISFEGVTFDYTANPGGALWNLPFRVSGGNDISFDRCIFDGDIAQGLTAADNGLPTGHGLALGGISGVSVTNSEFFNFWKAMSVGGSDDVVVTGNNIHDIRMDGMTFSGVQGVLVENNNIHNFQTSALSGDHADMIQFWTTGTTRPSTDIIIRGNNLDIGEGGLTQSIFMRNELVDTGAAGKEMYYSNVLIEGNVIVNGHLHGITVGETAGLTITGNSVLHADGNLIDGKDPVVEIPRISVSAASTGVEITHNATAAIAGFSGQVGWDVRMNAFVQDQNPNAPGWYGDVFITSSLTPQDRLHDFVAQPGGMLTTLNAGATATLERPVGTLDAAFNIAEDSNDLHTLTFDAEATAGPQPEGTSYLWTFGDGTTSVGKTVVHSFVEGGKYDVKLTVRLPDDTSDHAIAKIIVEDPLVVRLGDMGGFVVSSAGEETFLNAAMPLDSSFNLQLGGTEAVARIAHRDLQRIFGEDDLTIDFRLRSDAAGGTGEIFRLHSSLIGTVKTDGSLEIKVWSSEGGAIAVTSGKLAINDGSFHTVRMDLNDGKLALMVDGVKVHEVPFAGRIVDPGDFDLTFGSGWAANLQGDLDTFQIQVADETPTHNPDTSPAEPARDSVLVMRSDGDFETSNNGVINIIDAGMSVLANGNLQLSDVRKPVLRIDDMLFDRMFDSKDVSVSFRAAADSAGETGEIFRIHNSIVATVTSNGEVAMTVYTEGGAAVQLTSTGVNINDGDFHEVDLRLSDGRLSLWVDEKKVSDASFSGTIIDAGNYDLVFGSRRTNDNFAGELDTFHVSMGMDPLSVAALSGDAPLI